MRAFLVNQRSFLCQPPVVTAQLAASANYAMARYDNCDRIAHACPGYGSCGLWMTDSRGNLSVRLDVAVGYRLQIVPHAHLKSRCANIERQIEPWIAARQVLGQRVDPFVKFLL